MIDYILKNIFKIILWVFIATAPFLMEVIGEPYMTLTITRIILYALAAISLDFILGYGGMISLGHAVFFGIGAYSAAILSYHASSNTTIFGYGGSQSLLIAIGVAIVVSALFALITGALSLRTKGAYFIMITLAFAQVAYFTFVSITMYGADEGLIMYNRSSFGGLDLFNDTLFYYICALALGVFFLFYGQIIKSNFGFVLQACMQNEVRVRALGYNPYKYKLMAYVLSSIGASIAGVLFANLNEFTSPEYMSWVISGDLIIMVIIGGVTTIYGGILGAFVFIGLEEMLPLILGEIGYSELGIYWRLFFAPLLLMLVLYSNRGIIGIFKQKIRK